MYLRNLSCLLIAVLLTACAEAPTRQLDSAQQAIEAAKADPQVQSYSAAQLQQAEATLQTARNAWTQRRDHEEAEHLAYLAQRQAQIAQALGAEQAATAQSQQIMQERDALLLRSRSRQLERLQSLLAELHPKQTEQGIMLTLGHVLFAFNSAKLQPAGHELLDKLAAYLHDHSQIKVRIVGYTDSTGSADYNLRLSEQRAQSVADAMVQRGIDRDRMEVTGQGENNPVASNKTETGRQLNRRVEFTLLNQS